MCKLLFGFVSLLFGFAERRSLTDRYLTILKKLNSIKYKCLIELITIINHHNEYTISRKTMYN